MAIIKAKITGKITDAKLQSDIAALEQLIKAKAEKIQQKANALAAKNQRLTAAETSAARKLDARRKILIGGALLSLSKTDPQLKAALDLVMEKLDTIETNASVRKALGLAPLSVKTENPTP